MLGAVLHALHHLQRVHALVPDARLGQVLKDKLLRLNLKPTLAELAHSPQHKTADDNNDTDATTSSTNRLSPRVLCHLLEDLAHFQLAGSEVARDALQLVPYYLASMTPRQLAYAIAACCALGERDATVPAALLLRAALQGSSNSSNSNASPSSLSSASSALHASRTRGGVLQSGSELMQLMEALQRAGVRHEDVWSLLAEHGVRCMETFSARQLLRVLELFHAQRVTYCADFFVAAERYIAAQVAATAGTFMTREQLQEVIEYYKLLGQPVVSLLAVGAGRFADRFDTTLSLAAETDGGHGSDGGGADSRHTLTRTHARATSSSGGAALQTFVQTALRAFAEADRDELRQLLHKCDARGVMHDALMAAAVRRLHTLYFAHTTSQANDNNNDSNDNDNDDGDDDVWACDSSALARAHDVTRLTQTMVVMLRFDRPAYFAGVVAATRARSGRVVQMTSAALLRRMLDALAPLMAQHYHYRFLHLVCGAARVLTQPPLPSSSSSSCVQSATTAVAAPVLFYRALVQHLCHCSDITESMAPVRLHVFVAAMRAVHAHGGDAVLRRHMPVIAVEVTNVSRRVQAEVASHLACLPAAHAEVLPTIFRAMTRERQWHEALTSKEVQCLLTAMQQSGLRDAAVLSGVVAFMTAHTDRLRPDTLVRHLHTLALLGYRDIEFYIAAASHLLKRVPRSIDVSETCSNSSSRRSMVTAAATLTHTHMGRGGRARRHAASSRDDDNDDGGGSTHAEQQEQQRQQHCSTSAQDLCTLLYVFTFVLKDVIRVVQQIVARLKMCVAQTTPRDVVLVLYSMVKLRITRQSELTAALCAQLASALRHADAHDAHSCSDGDGGGAMTTTTTSMAATATTARCRGDELASAWGSLRALGYAHAELLSATVQVLHDEAQRRLRHNNTNDNNNNDNNGDDKGAQRTATSTSSQRLLATPLSDAQFVSIVSAVVHVTMHVHTARHVYTPAASTTTMMATQMTTSPAAAAVPALCGSAMHAPVLHATRHATTTTTAHNDSSSSRSHTVHTTAVSTLTQHVYKAAVVRMLTMLQRHVSSSSAMHCTTATAQQQQGEEERREGSATRPPPLPPASGLHVYLSLTTLPHLQAVRLTRDEWQTAVACADALHAHLTRGQGSNAVAAVARDDGGAATAAAAAEVLLALHYLRPADDGDDGDDAALSTLAPRLVRHVYEHRTGVLALPLLRDEIQRAGLLDMLWQRPQPQQQQQEDDSDGDADVRATTAAAATHLRSAMSAKATRSSDVYTPPTTATATTRDASVQRAQRSVASTVAHAPARSRRVRHRRASAPAAPGLVYEL